MGAKQAALNLMKNSHFNRTPMYHLQYCHLSHLSQLCWAGEKGEEQGDFVTKSPLGTRKFQFVALFGLRYGIAISNIKIQVCSNPHIFFSDF